MNSTQTDKPATVRQIIAKIAAEFAEGNFQRSLQDLPFEIQFRTGCTWGRALSYANDIRVQCDAR